MGADRTTTTTHQPETAQRDRGDTADKHNKRRRRSLSPPSTAQQQPQQQQPSSGLDDDVIEVPNYAPSGLLLAAANTFNSIALKYNQPPEARLPTTRQYSFFVFKEGKDTGIVLPLNRQTAWLVGRESIVCDLVMAHKSISAQHAALQWRQIKGGKLADHEIK